MAFLIGGANSAADTGYNVDNSCRFNDGDSPSMNKTASSGNTQHGTFSAWVKRGPTGDEHRVINAFIDGNNFTSIAFRTDDTIEIIHQDSGSTTYRKITTAVYRDPAAWMHLCVIFDLDDGTAEDRVKLFVNGTRVTVFGTNTNPGDASKTMDYNNSSATLNIGQMETDNYFDGYMAEVVWIDGLALAATSFGEFDEDSPTIFKPIDVSGLTFGTNGFYLDFEDSANLGNDANGGTDLTEVNLAATDQATDTPTNNFATMNPLSLRTNAATAITLSEGNLKAAAGSGSANWLTRYAFSNIGVSAGKWWVEIKCVDSGASNQFYLGIVTNPESKTWDSAMGDLSGAWGYYSGDGSIYHSGSHTGGTKLTYTDGDFIGIALDCDNGTVQFYKNGAVSSDQVTGLSTTADWFFALDGYAAIDAEFNFGSPPYSISSGNADGNGYGNFEHAPPSGFLALCTKNLGSDGG